MGIAALLVNALDGALQAGDYAGEVKARQAYEELQQKLEQEGRAEVSDAEFSDHEHEVMHRYFEASGERFDVVLWAGMILLVLGCALPTVWLHDINMSGWWYVGAVVPFLGSVLFLVALLWPGTKGANRFGPQPE